MILTVVAEEQPPIAQHLATLLDETWQVEVIGTTTLTGLLFCRWYRSTLNPGAPSQATVRQAIRFSATY